MPATDHSRPTCPIGSADVMVFLLMSQSSNTPVFELRISMSVSLALPEKSPKPAIVHSSPTCPMGQVGLEWTIAGFGDFSGNANETDMLMRNSNTGVFELCDINNNTIAPVTTPFGQVGLEWSISGVSATPAAAPPTTLLTGIAADPADAAPSSATAQLTQAMASFAP